MNTNQRIGIFAGLLIEAAMLIYPPWKVPGWSDDAYRFLFSTPPSWTPPAVWSYGSRISGGVELVGRIDIQRLEFQCLIVAIIVIGFVVLLGGKKRVG